MPANFSVNLPIRVKIFGAGVGFRDGNAREVSQLEAGNYSGTSPRNLGI
jgi:hypothetical protein